MGGVSCSCRAVRLRSQEHISNVLSCWQAVGEFVRARCRLRSARWPALPQLGRVDRCGLRQPIWRVTGAGYSVYRQPCWELRTRFRWADTSTDEPNLMRCCADQSVMCRAVLQLFIPSSHCTSPLRRAPHWKRSAASCSRRPNPNLISGTASPFTPCPCSVRSLDLPPF